MRQRSLNEYRIPSVLLIPDDLNVETQPINLRGCRVHPAIVPRIECRHCHYLYTRKESHNQITLSPLRRRKSPQVIDHEISEFRAECIDPGLKTIVSGARPPSLSSPCSRLLHQVCLSEHARSPPEQGQDHRRRVNSD